MKIGNVYLYETFANSSFSSEDEEYADPADDSEISESRNLVAPGIPFPEISNFPTENARR